MKMSRLLFFFLFSFPAVTAFVSFGRLRSSRSTFRSRYQQEQEQKKQDVFTFSVHQSKLIADEKDEQLVYKIDNDDDEGDDLEDILLDDGFWKDKGLSFGCTSCGKCCQNEGRYDIRPPDIYNINMAVNELE